MQLEQAVHGLECRGRVDLDNMAKLLTYLMFTDLFRSAVPECRLHPSGTVERRQSSELLRMGLTESFGAPIARRLGWARTFVSLTFVATLLGLGLANIALRATWHEVEDGVLWVTGPQGVTAAEMAPGSAGGAGGHPARRRAAGHRRHARPAAVGGPGASSTRSRRHAPSLHGAAARRREVVEPRAGAASAGHHAPSTSSWRRSACSPCWSAPRCG